MKKNYLFGILFIIFHRKRAKNENQLLALKPAMPLRTIHILLIQHLCKVSWCLMNEIYFKIDNLLS